MKSRYVAAHEGGGRFQLHSHRGFALGAGPVPFVEGEELGSYGVSNG